MVLTPEPQPPQPPVPSNTGTFNSNHTSVWLFVGRGKRSAPGNNVEKRREATRAHIGLSVITGMFSYHRRAGSFAVAKRVGYSRRTDDG